MKFASVSPNECDRLEELRKYGILDTESDAFFNNMVQLAAYVCQTPIAAISLGDENHQWFKAIFGVDAKEMHRSVSFCAHAILQAEPFVVTNALDDERFCDHPLVNGELNLRFYAGIPLVSSSGFRLGTLCVLDQKVREITQAQLEAVKSLAESVMLHWELRLSHKQIRNHVNDLQLDALIFDAASEGMLITDQNNHIITANPAFTTLTGYTLSEVIGKTPAILNSGKQDSEFYRKMWDDLETNGKWSGELWNRRKNGELYAEWLSITVMFNDDGAKRMHIAIFSDITEKKQADGILWKHANYDFLTKLPNRRLSLDRLEQEIKLAKRTGRSLALLFVDLDKFKQVNDTMGHEAGDLLLANISDRLVDLMRESDTIARLGGDEFIAILPQIDSLLDVDRVVNSIVESMSHPFDLSGSRVEISASIGVATCPADAQNASELLKRADEAMYAAKKKGGNCYCTAADLESARSGTGRPA